MSDENTTPVENTATNAHTVSRKGSNAARRAEFATVKAAKTAEKSAIKALEAQERNTVKENKQAKLAQVKAEKDATKAANKSAKNTQDVSPRTQDKVAKDPYRPRFATAPAKVRALTVVGVLFAAVHVLASVLLVLETSSSPLLAVLPEDAHTLAYLGALLALFAATLWAAGVALLCSGRVIGKTLGIVAIVLGLPFSLIAAPLLFSGDVRDWAL